MSPELESEAEELEEELKESVRQALDGDTFSDVEEIRERVKSIRERS